MVDRMERNSPTPGGNCTPELLKKDTLEAGETNVETEAFLIIADADGSNAKQIATEKGRTPGT